MALSAEELLELKKALDTPGAIKDEAYRTWALEQVQGAEDTQLSGWAGAGGTRADSAAPAPGALGVKGIIGQEQPPDEAEALAAQLDPRFDLMPQVLALQPATTDPDGDAAAEQKAKSGQAGDVAYAYEPPVSVVQKQLIENPAFLRAIRPSTPPGLDEIGALNETSPLYQDAANYLWRKTAEAAAQSGRTVYRYSQTPWLWGDQGKGVVDQLALKLGGAGQPLLDASHALVMGVDDTAALGAGRSAMETATPKTHMNVGAGTDYMGINEDAEQSTKDLNRWTAEQNPLEYGGGQVLGMLAPWGAAEKLFQGVSAGGKFIVDAIAKTRLGALASKAPTALKVAGRTAGDAAAGGVATGLEEAGQQAVDMGADAAQTGQAPSLDRLAAAGQSAVDTLGSGAAYAAGGSLLQQGARGGAEAIRDSERFEGKVRRAEPNLDTGLTTTATGLRLGGEAKGLQRQARQEGLKSPTDIIASEIAPPIRDKAAENTRRAEGAARASRSNYYQTPEGSAPEGMTHLQQQSLESLRDHYQPEPGGTLRAIDDKGRPAQKVFNSLVQDVSTSPVDGALKLSPEEAAEFLGPRLRHKLVKDDIEAAGARAADAPKVDIDRAAYLKTIKDSRARSAADEEIEAAIEDIVGDRTPTAAARAKAEQTVLRELVEEASFAEANGPLGDYLRQRGIDAVYVSPRAYDARRADTLIEGLGDSDLAKAAELDRRRRPMGGKKGGYAEELKKSDAAIDKAKGVEKRVAPGGDAFSPVASLGESRMGEKQLLDDTRALADQAGVRQQLDKLRGLQDTQEIVNRSRFRGRAGQNREIWNMQNQVDVGMLRALPVLKSLEGPLGALRGGGPALLGQDSAAPPGEASARSRYEAARDRRLKELAVERDDEKERRDRRRMRRAAGR